MKTVHELNEKILKITSTIKENYPELLKNIGETPVKINYKDAEDVSIKNLTEYINSLESLVKEYSTNHKALKK